MWVHDLAGFARPGLPALPGAAATRHWVIGVKCDFYPFGYVDAHGHHAGYDVEVAQEFAQLAFGRTTITSPIRLRQH